MCLKEESGANLNLKSDRDNRGADSQLEISGDPQAIEAAKQLVNETLAGDDRRGGGGGGYGGGSGGGGGEAFGVILGGQSANLGMEDLYCCFLNLFLLGFFHLYVLSGVFFL